MQPKTFMPAAQARTGIVCLGVLLMANCGGGGSDGSNLPISSQTLSGKIGGQTWSLVTAQSDAFLSTSTTYWVDMFATAFTACQGSTPNNANSILMELPNTPGNYPLSLMLNATFYNASTSDNLVATRGRIQIDSVTSTTITGGANFTYNADNTIDGLFQVTICP
jgi:hypothetical protein